MEGDSIHFDKSKAKAQAKAPSNTVNEAAEGSRIRNTKSSSPLSFYLNMTNQNRGNHFI